MKVNQLVSEAPVSIRLGFESPLLSLFAVVLKADPTPSSQSYFHTPSPPPQQNDLSFLKMCFIEA